MAESNVGARHAEQVIHDSLQEWNTEEFQQLGWNSKAPAKRVVDDLRRVGLVIIRQEDGLL